jgi:SPP1 family phage portal protein
MLDIKHTKKDLNVFEVEKLIDIHRSKISHYKDLLNMYDTNNSIRNRVKQDMTAPNNKIAHSYANYIVTASVGYFMGKNIGYTFPDDSYKEIFDDIYKFNDEAAVNMKLATDCSIFGQAVEMLFMDENSQVRFSPVDITEIIAIRNPDVMGDIHTIIRHWDEEDIIEDKLITYVEVFYEDRVERYSYSGSVYTQEPEIEQHPFGDVPFIVYDNNSSKMGDFEPVIDLINAYDKAQSDTANDFESFTDCYLVVKGATLDEEIAQKLKELKVFNFPDSEGDVSFVTKSLNDAATESYKNRLDNDIHKFSFVPNMSDENFASNASGVAMQYKLAGLNYKTSVKEALFKKGLLRRIELINNIINIASNEVINIVKDVNISFTRNTIDNLSETADLVNKLSNLVSKETALELLKDIIDPEQEKERVQQEKEANMALMQDQMVPKDDVKSEDVKNEQNEEDEE